jgi:hypothetical protein
MAGQPETTAVRQPVTDDSILIRQVSHSQFSWVAQEPGEHGVITLQLVLDQGAWEDVLTVHVQDAKVLRSLLLAHDTVHYDVRHRVLMFGTTAPGWPALGRPSKAGNRRGGAARTQCCCSGS